MFTGWLLIVSAAIAAHTVAEELSFPKTGKFRVTPHAQFSSTIGVLGCKVNTNRMAYFPYWPGCSGMCIKLKFGPRSRTVLHMDVSGKAHDISYDAFQYLAFGSSATASPAILNGNNDGAADMDYEVVDMAQCSDIITSGTGKLSFMAVSPNQVNKCLADSGGNNWLARNYELRNIADPQCQYGIDEVCSLDAATGTPKCPSVAGTNGTVALRPAQPVMDFMPPCGAKAVAGQAQPAPATCPTVTKTPNPSA